MGVPGVCCPRCRWVSAGDTGSRGAALGAPPSRLLGDWPPSRLRGALGRPRAEVTAAEFLPGRFPAPPQRPCQRGGREFTPARRNQGPLQRVSLEKWVWRGTPDLSLLQVHPPWPLTSSGQLHPKWRLFSCWRGWWGGEPPVLLDRAQEPATSDFTLGLQELTKPRE